MNRSLLSAAVLLIGGSLAFVAGCPNPAPPENAVTWGVKAATGQLTEATPGEWKAVAVKVDELTPEVDLPELTDDEAQAIVDFVQVNDLDSIQEIAALVEEAQTDPRVVQTLEIPDSVMELFGDVDFDAVVDDVVGG